MHNKNLKHFRVSLHDLHDTSIALKRQQYPTHVQHATRAVLQQIELFDR